MHVITPAILEDAPAIEKLVNSAYRGEDAKQGWTTEADLLEGVRIDLQTVQSKINDPNTLILKCVEDGRIQGCVELRKTKDGMHLGMLSVRPELQGKGVGKLLVHAVEAEARKQHCSKIMMMVITERKTLMAWYERLGYTDSGIRKPFNFDGQAFGIPKQPLEFMVLEKKIQP